ncbi:hypothetical protein ACFX5K_05120 [Rickettsiales bacterium LUAb2]
MRIIKVLLIISLIFVIVSCGKNGAKQRYSKDYPRTYPANDTNN